MFKSKQILLKAKASANEELRVLSNLVDDAGAFLLDVVWVEYGDGIIKACQNDEICSWPFFEAK